MKKAKISVIAAMFFLSFPLTIPVFAGSPSQMASLEGKCKKLVVGDKDKTKLCVGKLLQSIHHDGRVGFYVITKIKDDSTITTFSGFDGDKPDPDTQIQNVDSILINNKATNFKPTVIAVKGTCIYHNPYKGPQLIKCDATDEAHKSYQLEFMTNGGEPSVSKID